MTPDQFTAHARAFKEWCDEHRAPIVRRQSQPGGRTGDAVEAEAALEVIIAKQKIELMAGCLIANGFGEGLDILSGA